MSSEREKLKDEVYSDLAKRLAVLSKDENTKVGCIIMSDIGTPVSHGYNGTVAGFDDSVIPHDRNKKTLTYYKGKDRKKIEFSDNKYNYMLHAERNAIRFADKNKLIGSTLYVSGIPCKHCALEIASHKIKKVIVSNNNIDEDSSVGDNIEVTEFIFAQAGIILIVDGEERFLDKT